MAHRKDDTMSWKVLGAILILTACGGVGFRLASEYRQEARGLQELIRAIEFMQSELQFRMPPLQELMEDVAKPCTGKLKNVFQHMHQELSNGSMEDATAIVDNVLKREEKLHSRVRDNLQLLGNTLGRFDLSGQLSGLQAIKEVCQRDLDGLNSHKEERIRSYQTLGLCAGAALVILFI